MKSLFDEKNLYTEDAGDLDRMASNAIRPIFEAYLKEGYSPREISYVIKYATMDIEAMEILLSYAK